MNSIMTKIILYLDGINNLKLLISQSQVFTEKLRE